MNGPFVLGSNRLKAACLSRPCGVRSTKIQFLPPALGGHSRPESMAVRSNTTSVTQHDLRTNYLTIGIRFFVSRHGGYLGWHGRLGFVEVPFLQPGFQPGSKNLIFLDRPGKLLFAIIVFGIE